MILILPDAEIFVVSADAIMFCADISIFLDEMTLLRNFTSCLLMIAFLALSCNEAFGKSIIASTVSGSVISVCLILTKPVGADIFAAKLSIFDVLCRVTIVFVAILSEIVSEYIESLSEYLICTPFA